MKKNMEKIISSLVSVMILLTSFTGTCLAAEGDGKDKETVRSEVEMSGFRFGYFYSDSLFGKDATEMNLHLADISLMFSYAADDEDHAVPLYDSIGFTGVTFNDGYSRNDTSDKIGLVCAYKNMVINGRDVTVVSMTARGIGYEIEWANNFKVGTEGNHNGFEDNATRAADFLEQYIEDNEADFGSKDVKIWLNGYSRGGAVSYLAARKILERRLVSDKDLYVYTFSAPKAAVDDFDAPSVFNFVNTMDIIQTMFPEDWGFHRYGQTIELGDSRFLNSVTNQDLSSDDPLYDFEYDFFIRKISLRSLINGDISGILDGKADTQYGITDYYKEFTSFLEGKGYSDSLGDTYPAMKDRATYAAEYQASFVTLIEYLFSSDMSLDLALLADLDPASLIYDLLTECFEKDQSYKKTLAFLTQIFPDSSSGGTAVPEEETFLPLLRLIGKLVRMDSGASTIMAAVFTELPMLSTFIGSFGYITRGHYHDVVLAWLRYMNTAEPCVVNVSCTDGSGLPGGEGGDMVPTEEITLTGECVADKGSRVTVKASCSDDDASWLGWYDQDGNLVSRDLTYSFDVEGDVTLLASFVYPDPDAPTPTPVPEETEASEETSEDDGNKSERKDNDNDSSIASTALIVVISAGVGALVAVSVIQIVKKSRGKRNK